MGTQEGAVCLPSLREKSIQGQALVIQEPPGSHGPHMWLLILPTGLLLTSTFTCVLVLNLRVTTMWCDKLDKKAEVAGSLWLLLSLKSEDKPGPQGRVGIWPFRTTTGAPVELRGL